jgi:hypothetical protein
VQGMHLPESVEKAWKDVEHDLSDNPVSKGVESLQKITDPSVGVPSGRHSLSCRQAADIQGCACQRSRMTSGLYLDAELDHGLPEGQPATGAHDHSHVLQLLAAVTTPRMLLLIASLERVRCRRLYGRPSRVRCFTRVSPSNVYVHRILLHLSILLSPQCLLCMMGEMSASA